MEPTETTMPELESSIQNYERDIKHLLDETKMLTIAEAIKTTTLTETTTKTTVVESQGHTSTIILTLTKTEVSTIVNTVTHTIKPTQSSNYEPTIKPTIYTAPVTIRKVSGATSSIIPNPSFSIYANYDANSNGSEDSDNSNASNEEQSFEIDTAQILEQLLSPTSSLPKVEAETKFKRPKPSKDLKSKDSIFVVMTDKKNLGKLEDISTEDDDNDYGSAELFDNLPKRDEENHILLSGILIATPPRSSEVLSKKSSNTKNTIKATGALDNHFDINRNEEIEEHQSSVKGIVEENRIDNSTRLECLPECKAVNSEICQQLEDTARCVCRPGFARMFPDRPCKRMYLSYGFLLCFIF